MGDLLPCPFCGSANVGEPIRRRPLQVACIDCGGGGPEALTHDDARDRWNTRATPKPKRDPLTDPRPGDVVRWTHDYDPLRVETCVVWRVNDEVAGVVVTTRPKDIPRERGLYLKLDNWRHTMTGAIVLHTADEVTP